MRTSWLFFDKEDKLLMRKKELMSGAGTETLFASHRRSHISQQQKTNYHKSNNGTELPSSK